MADSPSRQRPLVFDFLDFRLFLKEWLDFLKAGGFRVSLTDLSRHASLTPGHLSLVLSGARNLSIPAFRRVAPSLRLRPTEVSYLELLIELASAANIEERHRALSAIKGYKGYRARRPKEFEVYQYLSHWYYVAIREMTALPDFQLDPAWIQSRLRAHVEIRDLREAIDFLRKNGFIEVGPDGKVRPPEKQLDCLGGVYSFALARYQSENFALAAKSIENAKPDDRLILSHTFAIDRARFDRAQAILSETLKKMQELERESGSCEDVYHVQLGLFPLTAKGGPDGQK